MVPLHRSYPLKTLMIPFTVFQRVRMVHHDSQCGLDKFTDLALEKENQPIKSESIVAGQFSRLLEQLDDQLLDLGWHLPHLLDHEKT